CSQRVLAPPPATPRTATRAKQECTSQQCDLYASTNVLPWRVRTKSRRLRLLIHLSVECNTNYCREGSRLDETSREVALGGIIGAATPAVDDPRPSFCSVGASSFPEGFSPCVV